LWSLAPRRVRRRLLAGAAPLLLGVAGGGPTSAAVVGRPALVPESRVNRVVVALGAHLAHPDVKLLIWANHHRRVCRERVGHRAQLPPDLHFSLLIEKILHLVP